MLRIFIPHPALEQGITLHAWRRSQLSLMFFIESSSFAAGCCVLSSFVRFGFSRAGYFSGFGEEL